MFVPNTRPTRATGPANLYAAKPPWDIDRPQPAFLAVADGGQIHGQGSTWVAAQVNTH